MRGCCSTATGDLAKARDLLAEALAMYEVLELPFHANRTRDRVDSLS